MEEGDLGTRRGGDILELQTPLPPVSLSQKTSCLSASVVVFLYAKSVTLTSLGNEPCRFLYMKMSIFRIQYLPAICLPTSLIH